MSSDNQTERGCRTSGIQLAGKCPFAAQKIYRDKVPGSTNLPALLGTMLHNVLEDYGRHCIELKIDTDFDYFDGIVEKHVASIEEDIQPQGRELALFLKDRVTFFEANNAEIAVVEDRIRLNESLEYDPNGTYFSSGLDLYYIAGDTAFVFDYKSGRKIFSSVAIESNLQKDFYPYLVFAKYPQVQQVAFCFDFIRYGFLTEAVVFTREEHFAALQRKLREHCIMFYETINTKEDLQARPSGFCILCEVKGLCPAINNALPKKIIVENDNDAVELARELKAMQIYVKEMSIYLKEWVDRFGIVKLGSTEMFGPKIINKSEIDDKYGLMQALKAAGLEMGDIMDCVSISNTKVKSKLKKKKIKIDLEKFVVMKPSTRFEFQDLETDDDDETE